MRPLLALLATAALGVGVGACGGGAGTTPRSTPPSPASVLTATTASKPLSAAGTATAYRKSDRDSDNDLDPHGVGPLDTALDFGHQAGAHDLQAITALVKRYYAAALAADGARACSLIYSPLAEAAAEDYAAPGAGPAYLRGAKTCREVVSRLFHHLHRQLRHEVPKLRVTHVLVKDHQGLVLLSFAPLPGREMSVSREGRTWKLDALLDAAQP